jgi:hypothetical protein
VPHLSAFVIGGGLIGAIIGAIGGFRTWPGYRSYYFGQYWSSAVIATATAGMIVGFIVGVAARAIFPH